MDELLAISSLCDANAAVNLWRGSEDDEIIAQLKAGRGVPRGHTHTATEEAALFVGKMRDGESYKAVVERCKCGSARTLGLGDGDCAVGAPAPWVFAGHTADTAIDLNQDLLEANGRLDEALLDPAYREQLGPRWRSVRLSHAVVCELVDAANGVKTIVPVDALPNC